MYDAPRFLADQADMKISTRARSEYRSNMAHYPCGTKARQLEPRYGRRTPTSDIAARRFGSAKALRSLHHHYEQDAARG